MNFNAKRRILIIDDQQAIHDTFDRVFASRSSTSNDALSDFESQFLDGAEAISTDKRDSLPEFELDHALSGEEGVRKLQESIDRESPYSLAFVDMQMPMGMDGMATAESLWKLAPDLHLVICTAYSDHTWDDVLDRLGYNDRLLLLKKPFEPDEARQVAIAFSEKARIAESQARKVTELGLEIERRRSAEENMRRIALSDPLTGLPNRPFLLRELAELVRETSLRTVPDAAVLFLDLDNFKIINDSLGHDAGDDLLKQVGGRLASCVRDSDTASRSMELKGETVRLGGDEFVVLLRGLRQPADALSVATRIVEQIARPFSIGDRVVNIGTSVGVAFLNEQIQDASEALRNADTAMYRAKHSGKGQVAVFDQTMHDNVMARLELEDRLRRAIRNQTFELHYQPIAEMKSARILGVEVLLRWKDENGCPVSPAVFIPILEEIGLISRVGEWVLETSIRDFTSMLNELPDGCDRDLYLGVNVSQRQLADPGFQDQLEAILEKTQFSSSQLKIEMTESTDQRSEEQTLINILDLHTSGIGIQIDDFGKGRSSLTCFKKYPVETVKIDRSFTASIASDHSHAAISQSIVQLAHNLSAKIVAEGVESEDQLRLLNQWGCDAVQGYLIAPPLTCSELKQFLTDPSQSQGIRMLGRSIASPPLPPIEFNATHRAEPSC